MTMDTPLLGHLVEVTREIEEISQVFVEIEDFNRIVEEEEEEKEEEEIIAHQGQLVQGLCSQRVTVVQKEDILQEIAQTN